LLLGISVVLEMIKQLQVIGHAELQDMPNNWDFLEVETSSGN